MDELQPIPMTQVYTECHGCGLHDAVTVRVTEASREALEKCPQCGALGCRAHIGDEPPEWWAGA